MLPLDRSTDSYWVQALRIVPLFLLNADLPNHILFVGVLHPSNIYNHSRICDSAHSSRLYGSVLTEDSTDNTITRYPTQSHYFDIEQANPCPTLVMPGVSEGSDR